MPFPRKLAPVSTNRAISTLKLSAFDGSPITMKSSKILGDIFSWKLCLDLRRVLQSRLLWLLWVFWVFWASALLVLQALASFWWPIFPVIAVGIVVAADCTHCPNSQASSLLHPLLDTSTVENLPPFVETEDTPSPGLQGPTSCSP